MRNSRKRGRSQGGFTLIELLVVIAVLGILSAVVLVAINPAERLKAARDAGAKSDIGQIATALEAFYTDENGSYPDTGAASDDGLAILETNNYLKSLPGVPSGSGSDDSSYQYSAYYSDGTACTARTDSTPCTEAAVWYDLEATGTGDWCYQTVTGTSADVTAGNCDNDDTNDG